MKECLHSLCGLANYMLYFHFSINSNLTVVGLFDDLLSNHNIGNSISVNDLMTTRSVKFFTNWKDTTNFPACYGSGIVIPGLDVRNKFILFIAISGVWGGYCDNTKNTINWFKLNS